MSTICVQCLFFLFYFEDHTYQQVTEKLHVTFLKISSENSLLKLHKKKNTDIFKFSQKVTIFVLCVGMSCVVLTFFFPKKVLGTLMLSCMLDRSYLYWTDP